MSTEAAQFGKQVFEDLNIDYETAYKNNPFKKACVREAISLLKPGSRVLDVGCGTGVPIAAMLAEAGMEVTGIDIAPKMIEIARSEVKGRFLVADCLEYESEGNFDAVFIIYSQLSLSYADVHAMVFRLAKSLSPGGVMCVGQDAADLHVPADDPHWDETHTYAEDFNLPFWGKPFKTLLLTRQGQQDFLTSMGLEIVSETFGFFQPDNPACGQEHQQYVIAQRRKGDPLSPPKPLPKGGLRG
ncbi:hypothetical protein LTR59_004574 [Friedmanniomyces endolithicus]|nr:hypothetical protein LTR94_004946 [Friedmanniomyces endolithicus]KAK0803787.1 hypothetical protein LTR59_004574 [Friedmanniomyces endolithicus]KAK0810096.1 hypothetical protein LTR38_004051 [Friedmanniomyces endolithicus]